MGHIMSACFRYVEWSRSHCSPRLTDSAAQLLQNNYVKIRQQMREQNNERGSSPIPITVRQLEAIVRISESLARMQL
jgi:DNA replication licensing factor MCM5